MTIEIDDSGTGDLVGDAFIGFLRQETGELLFKSLSVEFFKGDNWKNRVAYDKTVQIVKEGLSELNFNKKKEKILLCRGNIFDKVREYLDDEEISYEPAVIEGKLQNAVEERLVEHLRNDLGVRSRNLTIKSGAKRYFVLLNWVSRDFYNREKYVKSGFRKWNTQWRDIAIEKYKKFRKRNRNP